jgi:diamine N-acetyltransferase
MIIQGKKITLRTVLPTDTDMLLKWENDEKNWEAGGKKNCYTKTEIEDFIYTQKDIYLDGQLRLMICTTSTQKESVGCIDLFDFDEKKKHAYIGILIAEEYRKNNYATEALSLLIHHCFNKLHIRSLYSHAQKNNLASMSLFTKKGFLKIECKNDVSLLNLSNPLYV